MKVIEIAIKAPKCGASSEALKEALATVLGAEIGYVGARLAIMPPDVKTIVNDAVKSVRKVYKEHTLPWIGTERVCSDEKVDIVIDEINSVAAKSKKIIAEQAEAMKVWLPEVEKALGKGAKLVELPDPNDFTLTVTVGSTDPSKAAKGLPRSADEAARNEAIAKGQGFENIINHLIEQVDKIGSGKKASAAALRFKEDASTAAKMGAVNKEQLAQVNKLIGALLKAGNNPVEKAGAKASLVGAIINSAKPTEVETPKEKSDGDKKSLPKQKEPETVADKALALI